MMITAAATHRPDIMRRKIIYSIINPVKRLFIIVRIIIIIFIIFISLQKNQNHICHGLLIKGDAINEEQLHPALLVDTKYWLGNTELGEQENWLNGKKPCTLQERIRLDEGAVMSMSDYLDSIGFNGMDIRDLALPSNGHLLFEENTLSDSSSDSIIDPIYIHYLNESGDCLDTTGEADGSRDRMFNFRPTRDQMSWFNPENWASSLYERDVSDWIPEAHRIPCSEDVVVFGSREMALGPTLDGNEQSKLLSFKVNFEPSEFSAANQQQQLSVDQIRLSKLKIGNYSYNQHEFEQLINSEQYENILFEFNSSRNALKPELGFAYPTHSLLTIDESSILPDTSSGHYCLDEAGCLCGNDQTNVMGIICSFNHPIEPSEQPCHDPIQSAGYCNKICATTITIIMDPSRFSEKFLSNTLYKLLSDGEVSNYFADSVFTGARRTHDNKYEITFRNVSPLTTTNTENDSDSNKNLNYETNLGKERELAQLVYEKLNNGATKTFYGIKSLTIKSSVDWRRSNRKLIFWISYSVLTLVAVTIFVIQTRFDNDGDERLCSRINRAPCFGGCEAIDWLLRFFNGFGGITKGGNFRQETTDTESFVRYTEPIIMTDSITNETTNKNMNMNNNGNQTTSEIALVDLVDSV